MPGTPGSRWVLLPEEAKEEKKDGVEIVRPRSGFPEILTSLSAGPFSGGLAGLTRQQAREVMVGRLGGRNNGRSGGWQNYTVRLVAFSGLSFTAGVAAAAYVCDPSSSSMSEWSTFAALFDEVKCVGFDLSIQAITPVGVSGVAIGSFTRTTSSPPSASAVFVAPDAVMANPNATEKLAYRHVMKYPRDILYAATSSPTPGPYAGCPGSIQVYSTGTSGSFDVLLVGHYALRGRL